MKPRNRWRTNSEYGKIVVMLPSETAAEDRQRGALLIAASLIAAIRLRGEPVTNSPKVMCAVQDAIKLARMVMGRLQNR